MPRKRESADDVSIKAGERITTSRLSEEQRIKLAKYRRDMTRELNINLTEGDAALYAMFRTIDSYYSGREAA